MKIMDRYLLREHLAPFFFALAVTTFILLMDKLFELIDLLIGKRVAGLLVLKIFALSLPSILALTVPMAVLVAVLMTFGRISGDNELTALKSAGLPLSRLLVAPVLAGMALTLGLYFFTDRILPEANHSLKNTFMAISSAKPALRLKENTFVSDFTGYNILVGKVDAGSSRLHKVTIYESIPNGYPRTIIADEGQLTMMTRQNVLRLELWRGQIHEADVKDPRTYHKMDFNTHVINLPLDPATVQTVQAQRGDREMTSRMMQGQITQIEQTIAPVRTQLADSARLSAWQKEQFKQDIHNKTSDIRRYQVEIQKKLAIPFACLVFVLLGVPLGSMTRKGSMGASIGMALGFFVLYYLALVGGEELADRQIVSPWLAMWVANIALGTCGVLLLLWQNSEIDLRKLITKKAK
ncbi:LptF/LptG family permease [candidate division TA06 bacterium]|nr:LptF/LptG family permease [candidate division TA06 bacterium]